MLWGYGGVWSGDYEVWKCEDQLMGQLEFIVAHGFRSASAPLGEMKDPARRDQIAAFVAEHDLQLTVHPHVKWMDEDRDAVHRQVDEFLDDLAAYKDLLRVPIVTMGAGPYHRFMESPTLAEQFDRLADALTPMAARCFELGCPLGIENHGDYYCSDLVELCKRVPHLGIFLDTGNCFLIGEKPVPAAREAAPYVIGTHFKDHFVWPETKGGLSFQISGASLGDGHVGLAEIYDILRDHAPNPDKIVMHWELVPPPDMNGLESMNRSWDFVKSLPGVLEDLEVKTCQ